MSNKFLKLSLAIAEEGLSDSCKKKKQSEKSTWGNPFNSLPENKGLISKKKKRKIVNREEISQPKKRINIMDLKKSIESNSDKNKKIEENIEKLLRLSSTSHRLDEEGTEKIFKRARIGRYVMPEENPKVEEKSVFTDADFDNIYGSL